VKRQSEFGNKNNFAGSFWTSKMGDEEDVEPVNPSVFEGKAYGTIAAVMKRKNRHF